MSRAEEMRASFDRAFAEPAAAAKVAPDEMLSVTLGGSAYAIRVAEVAGVSADKPVTPLPSPIPALRGLCASRGVLVPVYDLAQLLGYARARDPRWLCLLASPALGLAFESFEGHLRVDRAQVVPAPSGAFVREAIDLDGRARSIIHLPSVVGAILARARPHEER